MTSKIPVPVEQVQEGDQIDGKRIIHVDPKKRPGKISVYYENGSARDFSKGTYIEITPSQTIEIVKKEGG